jgi:hypothetical protein
MTPKVNYAIPKYIMINNMLKELFPLSIHDNVWMHILVLRLDWVNLFSLFIGHC